MKLIAIIALAMVAASYAAPAEEPAKILKSEFTQSESGYSAAFETENGIVRSESGQLKDAVDADNKPIQILVTRGSWSYINNEGNPETIEWTADENGFHPNGPSIPKSS